MTRRFNAAMLLLLSLLWLATGCRPAAPEEASASTAGAGTPAEVTLTADQIAHGGVRWTAVSATPVADFVEVSGRLLADEDRTARLSPSVRGRVSAVSANLGDTVTQGQVLVTLQSEEASARRTDLAKANAELIERRAALNFARAARERAERLLGLKAGSVQDVERTRSEEATAQAGASQAEAALDQAKAALAVLEVDAATGQVLLASPIGGVIIARDAVVGAVLEAGASALTVTDPASLWLEFGASDPVASSLKAGQRLTFVVPAPTGTFEARVLRVSGGLDPATRLLTVRAAVANGSRTLRPEMFVTVRVDTSAPHAAVAIPHEALQLLDQRSVVFLAQPDGKGGAKFIRREVETGTTAEGRTHIIKGLSIGDVVVTEGAFAVKSEFSRGKMPAGG